MHNETNVLVVFSFNSTISHLHTNMSLDVNTSDLSVAAYAHDPVPPSAAFPVGGHTLLIVLKIDCV